MTRIYYYNSAERVLGDRILDLWKGKKVEEGEVLRGKDPYTEESVEVEIKKIKGSETAVIDRQTKFIPSEEMIKEEKPVGLDDEIEDLRRVFETRVAGENVPTPAGILLYGPPGCGKTMLVRYLAERLGLEFKNYRSSQIYSSYLGESEKKVESIFKDAKSEAEEKGKPIVLFFDEIESLIPKRTEITDSSESRVVSLFLEQLDGVEDRGDIIIVGATNMPDKLDPALRRPGRLDKEILIKAPSKTERKEMIKQKMEEKYRTLFECFKKHIDDKEKLLEVLGKKSSGFTGADIESFCKNANLELRCRGEISELRSFLLRQLKQIQPSLMREEKTDIPDIAWNDVCFKSLKNEILEKVKDALKRREEFERYAIAGITPPQGLFFYGPPGCGKTFLMQAIANKLDGINFISIEGPEVFSKWLGESEKAIRNIFSKARTLENCIIFFDEIEAIARRGGRGQEAMDRVTTQLLTEIDGIEELKDVVVIGATNRPNLVDPALRRPGRLGNEIYVPPLQTRIKKENGEKRSEEEIKENHREKIEEYLKNRLNFEDESRVQAEEFSTSNIQEVVGELMEKVDIQDDDTFQLYTPADLEDLLRRAISNSIRKGHDFNFKDMKMASKQAHPRDLVYHPRWKLIASSGR